ncbi:MAG TPA: 50S ribosomal protein L24 [Xanthomonadales bacterium]|nr:50S ribosomal protein L24 [Xanthomonadales bacterium]
MKRIRKGDEVIVTTGRSKGQRGHVLRVMGDNRMLVENVNMIKKHQKPNPSVNQPGGIVEKEASIHASNVQVYNAGTGKADRVGFKTLEDGRKVRVFKSTGEAIDI